MSRNPTRFDLHDLLRESGFDIDADQEFGLDPRVSLTIPLADARPRFRQLDCVQRWGQLDVSPGLAGRRAFLEISITGDKWAHVYFSPMADSEVRFHIAGISHPSFVEQVGDAQFNGVYIPTGQRRTSTVRGGYITGGAPSTEDRYWWVPGTANATKQLLPQPFKIPPDTAFLSVESTADNTSLDWGFWIYEIGYAE